MIYNEYSHAHCIAHAISTVCGCVYREPFARDVNASFASGSSGWPKAPRQQRAVSGSCVLANNIKHTHMRKRLYLSQHR